MTIDAFLADDLRLSSFIECDCLMSAIIAGYAASSTSDAEFAVSYVSHIYFRVASRRDTSHQGHKIAALTIIATGFCTGAFICVTFASHIETKNALQLSVGHFLEVPSAR